MKNQADEKRSKAKHRAEQSRLRAVASGRPRTEWVNEAIARSLAAELRDNAIPADIAVGVAKVDAKQVLRGALSILIGERGCDRRESLGALSRALGVISHTDRKQITSAPSATSQNAL